MYGCGKIPGILIFGGTTEGRMLAEYVSASYTGYMENQGRDTEQSRECGGRSRQENWPPCYVCTATEYGGAILNGLPGVCVRTGRMDEREMRYFMEENDIGLVIDATHPFAREATRNIRAACELVREKRKGGTEKDTEGIRYIRCIREETENPDDQSGSEAAGKEKEPPVIQVDSVEEAVSCLQGTEGNILIATGSRELYRYTQIADFRQRCFARVLSTREALEESLRLGFEGRHLIAMQGPFSVEMNLALLRQTEAAWFVTKASGAAGGFEEKLEASRLAGAGLVVIRRMREEGADMEKVKKVLDTYMPYL